MKLSKTLRLLVAVALVLTSVLAFASCEGDALIFGDYDFNDIDDHNPNYADKVYTVQFDSDGGSAVESQSVSRGESAIAPETPEKIGYVFSGWYYKSVKWDFENYAVRSDMTLTAKWTKNNTVYSVAFDSNGGNPIPPQNVREGEKVLVPTTPTLTENRFLGWYVGEELWDFSAPVVGDMTLTAKWTPIVYYTVSFDIGEAGSMEPIVVAEDTPISVTEPTLARHRFGGWYVGESEWPIDTPVTADVTLTAKWIPIVYYTVTLDTNGGSALPALEVEEGTPVIIPEKPILDGYRLIGWTCGGEAWDLSTPVTEDITLTASWKQRPENLIYDPDTTSFNVLFTRKSGANTREKFYDELVRMIEEELGTGINYGYYNDFYIAEHEIVIGDATEGDDTVARQISKIAYWYLNNRVRREEGMKYFLIYSDGSSVAIVYDDVEDERVGVAAMHYFMMNYIGEELALAPGVVYIGSVPYSEN